MNFTFRLEVSLWELLLLCCYFERQIKGTFVKQHCSLTQGKLSALTSRLTLMYVLEIDAFPTQTGY